MLHERFGHCRRAQRTRVHSLGWKWWALAALCTLHCHASANVGFLHSLAQGICAARVCSQVFGHIQISDGGSWGRRERCSRLVFIGRLDGLELLAGVRTCLAAEPSCAAGGGSTPARIAHEVHDTQAAHKGRPVSTDAEGAGSDFSRRMAGFKFRDDDNLSSW